MYVGLSQHLPERSASFPHRFLSRIHFLSGPVDVIQWTGNDIFSCPISHSAFSLSCRSLRYNIRPIAL